MRDWLIRYLGRERSATLPLFARLHTVLQQISTLSKAEPESLQSLQVSRVATLKERSISSPLHRVSQTCSHRAILLAAGENLAVWLHDGPIFVEERHRKRPEILDRLWWDKCRDDCILKRHTPVERTCDFLASWTGSNVHPSDDWEDMRWIKWNPDIPLNFSGYEDLDFQPYYNSTIGPKDKARQQFDRNLWL